ncbi:MAG: acyltransferase [Lachnospiraceae bacterium]|nr:acyltransferase [Lachnospiraceae bacterium]
MRVNRDNGMLNKDGPTAVILKEKNGKPARLANMELLRCIAMMMIVVLHYLGKGDILADLSQPQLTDYGAAAWILECFCIVAVNVYMLISGYFSRVSSFRLSKLLKLYIQVWLYSVIIGFAAYFLGIYPAEEFSFHYVLTLVLPITMGHYWFMTAYVFMYILMPLCAMAIKYMNRRQMQAAIALLLVFNCLLKSVIPARLEMDGQGYDFMWYLCVFMVAAYIGRFAGGAVVHWLQGIIIYFTGVVLIFVELMALHIVYVKTGSLEHIIKISIEYNHIFPLIAAIGLFMAFLKINIRGRAAAIITKISPYTLGVYLLHENIALRYKWQKWLWADRIDSVGNMLMFTAAAVVVVFIVGIAADVLRERLMRGLHAAFMHLKPYRFIVGRINDVGELFSGDYYGQGHD